LPKVSDLLRSYLAYQFMAVGVVWAVVAVWLGLALVLWPALTCLVGGALQKLWPSGRLTWPWVTSAAVLGFLVSGYQAYLAIPFVGGTFSAVASETLAAFAIFALVHLVLLWSGYVSPGKPAK
jgi:hypothetical protein